MKKRNWFVMVPIIIMLIIYYSSSMSGQSQDLSTKLMKVLEQEPFYHLLAKLDFSYGGYHYSVEDMGYILFVQFLLRKAAHFAVFFLLACGWYLSLSRTIKNKYVVFVLSFILCAAYAVFDEYHQSFSANRTGMIEDVLLDSLGSLLGLLASHFINFIKKS